VREWQANEHLVVEDLGLARLGLGDEGVIEDVEDILADLLELGLDLLAVVADGADVLLGALGLLLLLDRRDDAPRGTACTDNVLVGDGQKVALIDGQLTADLLGVRSRHVTRGVADGMCHVPCALGGHGRTFATSCTTVSIFSSAGWCSGGAGAGGGD
jgi:hypothetical protein